MCTKDYKLEGTDVVIEEGTSILIPALGLQRDPEYYPDPLKWDPERFNDANKSQHNSGAYVPFGDGPRNCIGKYHLPALLEMHIILLLMNGCCCRYAVWSDAGENWISASLEKL